MTQADHVAVDLASQLASHPKVIMKETAPVPVSNATELLASSDDIIVVVLVCLKAEVIEAVARLRAVRPHLAVVCVPIDANETNVMLANPSRVEVIEIVSTLLNLDQQAATKTGQLLVFPSGQEPSQLRQVPAIASDKQSPSLIQAGLEWVDGAAKALLDVWQEDPDGTPGFTLTWDGLGAWLKRFVRIVDAPTAQNDRLYEQFEKALEDQASAHYPLKRIADLLGNDGLSLKLLLVVLSAELDIQFHRLFGVMHDDLGRRQPSIALACAILATATAGARPFQIRMATASLSRLRSLGLIEGFQDVVAEADAPLGVPAPVLDWILTGEDDRLLAAPQVRAVLSPTPQEVVELVAKNRQSAIAAAISRAIAGRKPSAVVVTGSDPSWLGAEVAATFDNAISARIDGDRDGEAIADLLRAALLSKRRILIQVDGEGATALWSELSLARDLLTDPPIIVAENAAPLLGVAHGLSVVVAEIPPPTNADRRMAVASAMRGIGGPVRDGSLVAELADRFRLPLDRMPDATVLARAFAADADRSDPNETDWRAGFRQASCAHLPALARRIEPTPSLDAAHPERCLDRVVLPKAQKDQLIAIMEHVRFGRRVLDDWGFGSLLNARGVSALFSGPSGTGKTLAAQAIASALAVDLYVVDLARIVSKYIGETEKNLHTVFEEAEMAGAVLLFDEADALFGKRSAVRDAHDRYANIEVAFLLQRMELFDGLAILTTNHPENVDPAFARRLRFTVDFPRPDPVARRAIWEISIPAGPYRDSKLDLEFLARRLDLTGGSIRQVALHAAMAAARDDSPIGQAHVLEATRGELVRMGAFSDLDVLEGRAA